MIKFLINKWTHAFLLLSLLVVSGIFSYSDNDLRKRFQYFIFDSYNKIIPRAPSDDVVIVDLDENSLRQIGQWPWPRDVMADLITNINDLGAKSIAFDIVFAEEDRTSPAHIVKRLPENTEYKEAKDLISKLPDNDDVFSQAIQKVGKVVTGFTSAKSYETRREPYQPIAPTLLLKNKNEILVQSYQTKGVATNLTKFSHAAAGNGHFMVAPETDGIIRQVSLFSHFNPPQFKAQSEKLYPLLSLEALRVSIDPKARMIVRDIKEKHLFDLDYQIKLGNYEIPMDADGKFWVHYRKIDRNEYIPAHLILDKNEAAAFKERIKDKIVFIGTSAEGLRDIRSTPLERFVPGVEVHVNIVEQILQGRYLKRPAFIKGAEAVLIAVSGLVIILLAPFIHVAWLGLITIFLITATFFSSWYGFLHEGLLLDPVYPAFVLFFLFISSSLLSYLRSELDRRQVKTAFGHYVSPVFLEELTKNPEKLKLGGEVKELTVMFTDIRSFTSIAEELSPEELIQLMNDFLTPMSDLVMESRGTIDKYMGDAMMAFWNAPLDDPGHAQQACLTALAMNEALKPVNDKIKARAEQGGREPKLLSAGIGINTGKCSVGNMGSKQRFAYSALGDPVNLASRLEGQTKTYGVDILIGEDTYKQIKDMAVLELDLIQVVGREKPVKVYTIIGGKGVSMTEEFKQWQAAHNSMLAAYRIADLSCAAQDCKEASDLAAGQLQKYYALYMERIIELTKNPPPEDWSGVFVAKGK